MDDITICRRIAEIEGIKTHEYKGAVVPHYKFNDAVNDCKDNVYGYSIDDYSYDPLTDDALCFKLMVKYKIDFNHAMFTDGTIHRYEAVNTETGQGFGFSENPNKAICLAIIESHKEK